MNMGSQIHLVCNASGISRAPEKIDWFFKGNRIHPSNPRWKGRVAILKHTAIPGRSFISELVIKQSTIADQGDYVCRSSDLKVTNLKVHVLNGKYLSRWIFSMTTFNLLFVFTVYLIALFYFSVSFFLFLFIHFFMHALSKFFMGSCLCVFLIHHR